MSLFARLDPIPCPACRKDGPHPADASHIHSCSRCGWRFVVRDGEAQDLINVARAGRGLRRMLANGGER